MLRKFSVITAFALLGALTLFQSKAMADGASHWEKVNPNTILGKISLAVREKFKHVPSIKEINAPIYPGVKIFLYEPHGLSSLTNKEDKRALPRFALASGDSFANVIHFYKSHLKGYKRLKFDSKKIGDEVFVKHTLFVKDTGQDAGMANYLKASYLKASFNSIKKLAHHPNVSVRPADSISAKAIPDAKSIIYITYRPQSNGR
jgi:hypothetical protein